MQFENLLGLPLPLARQLVEGESEVVVVATAPPFMPRGYTPHWGEERVLRARLLGEGRVELLVAKELIGEERAALMPKSSSQKKQNPVGEEGTKR